MVDPFDRETTLRVLGTLVGQDYTILQCSSCRAELVADWFPLVVLVRRLELVIYATPGVDDRAAESAYRDLVAALASMASKAILQILDRTPFTVVYARQGLQSLLHHLGLLPGSDPLEGLTRNWRVRGFEAEPVAAPGVWNFPDQDPRVARDVELSTGHEDPVHIRFLHAPDQPRQRALVLHGFSYGELFFYYPDFLHCIMPVHALATISTALPVSHQRKFYGLLMESPLARMGHPWVLKELSRLAITQDPGAMTILVADAIEARCRHISVTTSFLDATPPRRSDGAKHVRAEAKAADLIARGLEVDFMPHAVTQLRPAESDYGRWHFPLSELPDVEQLYQFGAVYGHTLNILGTVARILGGRVPAMSGICWSRSIEHALEWVANDSFLGGFRDWYKSDEANGPWAPKNLQDLELYLGPTER